MYHVIEGKGYSTVDGICINWQDKDTFVVPSGANHEHAADKESVLYAYSDSPILKPLDLCREEEYTENDDHQAVSSTFVAGATG